MAKVCLHQARKENILYYSVGSEIYRYNYLSAGNFPTQSDYTVGVSVV